MYKKIEYFLTQNPCYKENKKITVKGIMLHSVGCAQPSAMAFINYWNDENYGMACTHGFIDANTGVLYQTLPWDHRGWHSGGTSNDTHIGIEMCEPDCITYTGGADFTCQDDARAKEMAKRTYEVAVELFADLCMKYKLNPLEEGIIISHSEGYKKGVANNHADPEHLWNKLELGYTMHGFREAVKAAMKKEHVEAGKTVQLNNIPCYVSEIEKKPYMNKNGIFFLWDSTIRNGRIRITNASSRVGVPGQVTCWININDVGLVEKEIDVTPGKEYILSDTPVYNTENGKTIGNRTGNYFVWDSTIKNNRVRMTNNLARVGMKGQVSFWINIESLNNPK